MAIFEVYQKTGSARFDEGETCLVRDRASIAALLFPALWLTWHRLWFALAAYLLVSAFIFALAKTELNIAAAAVSFLQGLYVFLEGPNWIASKLHNSGYQLVGLIDADNLSSAETRWFMSKDIQNSSNQSEKELPHTSAPLTLKNIRPNDTPEFGIFASE